MSLEVGFALGLGKQVILTFQKSDVEAMDFDTNAFENIIFETVT